MKVQFDKYGKPIITDELAAGYLDRDLNADQRGLLYRALRYEQAGAEHHLANHDEQVRRKRETQRRASLLRSQLREVIGAESLAGNITAPAAHRLLAVLDKKESAA